jgi:beta-lactamase regulating signal transducer with metallopeptidase domain
VDARSALVLLVQPVCSFLMAGLIVTVCWKILPRPPKRLRAYIWLIPLAKLAIDLCLARPDAWVGTYQVDPVRLKPGQRMGTISLGISTLGLPVPFGTMQLECTRPGAQPPDVRWPGFHQVWSDIWNPPAPQPVLPATLAIHPGDLLYGLLGPVRATWLVFLVLVVSGAFVTLRAIRLLRHGRRVAAQLAAGRARPDRGRALVISVPGLTVPFATGFLRPKILIPAELEATLTPAELEALLAHEREHVRGLDPFLRVVLGFASDLFWYVPGLTRSLRMFADEREKDCDDAAAQEEPVSARRLARVLLKAYDWARSRADAAAVAPAWAPAAAEARNLTGRLQRLLHPAPRASRWRTGALVASWLYLFLIIARSSLGGLP